MISKELLSGMARTPSSGGGGATPILDAYGQPYAAWSSVKLHSAFTGTVRVRESTGGTETEISYGADNLLDASAIDTHLGGGSGTVVDVDNQGTFGGSMSQSSTSIQPNIIDSTVLTSQKAFDSVGDNLYQDFGSAVLDRNTFDVFAVFIPKASSGYQGVYGYASVLSSLAQLIFLMSVSGTTQFRNYVNGVRYRELSIPSIQNQVCVSHIYRDNSSSDAQGWFSYNGNTYSGSMSLGSSLSAQRYVMWSGERISALGSTLTGELSALIIYQGTALSSGDRTAIRSALQAQFV